MFVYPLTFILTVWDFLWCKIIVFEVETLILHPFIEPKASSRHKTIDISAVTTCHSHPMICEHVTLLVAI